MSTRRPLLALLALLVMTGVAWTLGASYGHPRATRGPAVSSASVADREAARGGTHAVALVDEEDEAEESQGVSEGRRLGFLLPRWLTPARSAKRTLERVAKPPTHPAVEHLDRGRALVQRGPFRRLPTSDDPDPARA